MYGIPGESWMCFCHWDLWFKVSITFSFSHPPWSLFSLKGDLKNLLFLVTPFKSRPWVWKECCYEIKRTGFELRSCHLVWPQLLSLWLWKDWRWPQYSSRLLRDYLRKYRLYDHTRDLLNQNRRGCSSRFCLLTTLQVFMMHIWVWEPLFGDLLDSFKLNT